MSTAQTQLVRLTARRSGRQRHCRSGATAAVLADFAPITPAFPGRPQPPARSRVSGSDYRSSASPLFRFPSRAYYINDLSALMELTPATRIAQAPPYLSLGTLRRGARGKCLFHLSGRPNRRARCLSSHRPGRGSRARRRKWLGEDNPPEAPRAPLLADLRTGDVERSQYRRYRSARAM